MAKRKYPRHLLLLLSILLLFILSSFVVPIRHGVVILNVVGVAVLLAGVYAVGERKLLFAVAIVLSILSIVGTSLLLNFPSHWAVLASHLSILVLLVFFAISILGYVLSEGRITSDKIFAAVCVYMLVGYAWAFAYALIDELQPGSFTAPAEIKGHDYSGRVMQLRYFSFVTLTSVGYGDIVPLLPAAQTMAMLEAVTGQLYLVALVGRLIGLHIVHSTRSQGRDQGRAN